MLENPRLRILSHLSDLRSLHYLVDGVLFEEIYASTEDKTKIDKIILDCQNADSKIRDEARQKLKDWMRGNDKSEISTKDLMKLAQSYGVPNYSRLTRPEIFIAINRLKTKLPK